MLCRVLMHHSIHEERWLQNSSRFEHVRLSHVSCFEQKMNAREGAEVYITEKRPDVACSYIERPWAELLQETINSAFDE